MLWLRDRDMLTEARAFKRFCDAIWEYHADTNQIYVHHDRTTPEVCGEWKDYEELYRLYREQYVYREDVEIWQQYMNPNHLREFLNREDQEDHFFVRIEHKELDRNSRKNTEFLNRWMEWHEVYISKIDEKSLMIASRDVREEQRNLTIAQAVLPEFDYVCRIDVATNNYVIYYSDKEKHIIPKHASENYHTTMERVNHKNVIEEEVETLCKSMRVENVVEHLEHESEYILYATMEEDGVIAHKKYRFCYVDSEKKAILLTRTDVSGIIQEKQRREREERKRLSYLENMPVAFCSIQVLLDEDGKPKDFLFTYSNREHDKLEGAGYGELIGRKFYEYFKNGDLKWLKYYYETAYEGIPHVIREYSREIQKELLIHTFQTERGHCECVMQDITKESVLTLELHQSWEELKRILETTTTLVFQYDPENSKVILDQIGVEDQQRQQSFSEQLFFEDVEKRGLIGSTYAELVRDCLKRIREGEHHISVTIQAKMKPEQNWTWYRMTLFDYLDEYTNNRRVVGYLQNIDQDIMKQEKLRQRARMDSLTGLLNVGAGKRRVEKLLEAKKRNMSGYNALFLMDIDDFKNINDTMGHKKGDETIQCFVRVLKRTFRAEDVIYRMGGDEFAVFVERLQTPDLNIDTILRRLRAHIEEARREFPFLSVSTGAYLTNGFHTYDEYYVEADRALYETKKKGKNHDTIHKSTEGADHR